MGKKDFSNLEDQIRDTVKNAFDAIDFARIKKDIDYKAESTMNEVKSSFESKSQQLNEKIKDKVKNKYKYKYKYGYENVTDMVSKDENKVKKYIAKRPVGSISGILYTVFGSILSGVLGISLLSYSIVISLWSVFSIANYIGFGLLAFGFVSSIGLTLRGIHLRKRVKRFKEYVKSLNSHNYCSIEDLANVIKKKNKYIVKDLRKMIELGMFSQAHIDDKQTYFMLNDEVYENYLNSQEALKKRAEDEAKREEELNKEANDPSKKELRHTIEMGRSYINEIKILNDSINSEKISTKLSRLYNIVNQILNHIENNPRKLPEVNKFANHYLPITLKLVSSYKELSEQPVQGENIRNAKSEIEKSIDTINVAFEKLLDDLFEEIALDISTDISVLETLFTQEGLTKNDFEK